MAPAGWPYRRHCRPPDQQPTTRTDGLWAFKQAIIYHRRKGTAVALDNKAVAIPMVGGALFDAPEPLKEEAKEVVGHHPARGLNPDKHTIQEAQDTPWIGARGLNTGPGLVTP